MKTLVRIITVFIVLTFITSDLASGQTSRVNEPVSQAPQYRTTTNTSRTSLRETRAPRSLSEPPSSVSSEVQAYEEALRLDQKIVQADQLYNVLQDLSRTGSKIQTRIGSENILVIPTGEIGFEELLTINEDMNVMSRIFANGLGRQRTATSKKEWYFADGRSVPYYESILGRSANNTISSMYLQGYGALFMMKVDFPLSAPPETQQQQEETEKEDVDYVWEQTRQQIYEPQVESRRRTRSDQPEIIYDAEQIENLKTTLIESLKHAANIRALAPDESVIIRIAGSGQSVTVTSIAKEGEQSIISYESNGTQRTTVTSKDFPDFIKSLSTPSVLVIRAKKSDIDDFAKGELDLEDFREKVQVLSYPLLGGNAGGTPVSRTRSTGTSIVTR